jgi:PhzF family phenazine biosynthesis protein
MHIRPFKQVDVFSATPYLGNPLAVVLDGAGLSSQDMQHFARWTHLSETTFLLPPSPEGAAAGADYRVRIFTPAYELPFAGHPTLGSCHAWLQGGGQPRASDLIVQECAKGLVRIRRDGTRLAFAAPALACSTPAPELLEQVRQALGLRPDQIQAAQLLDNGPVWLSLLLDSVDTVLALSPNHTAIKQLGYLVGVCAIEPASHASVLIARSNREARAFVQAPPAEKALTLEVRAMTAVVGVDEDPVTGSLNASLAQWLIAEGLMPTSYIASQGTCVQRAGQVHVMRDGAGQVWVGGDSVTCIDGSVTL